MDETEGQHSEPNEAADHVNRGAALLDEHVPGWYDKIDIEQLEMSECANCVLGQVFADQVPEKELSQIDYGLWGYEIGLEQLGLTDDEEDDNSDVRHGFDRFRGTETWDEDYMKDYDLLKQYWVEAVESRRVAARQDEAVLSG